MLATILILISAGFWFAAGQAWQAFARRVEACSEKVRRSVAAYRRHQEKLPSQQTGSTARTCIRGDLEFPALPHATSITVN
ncbi:hypothetical protein ACFRAU_12705 [Arthrobacter sp. NPDC056691]|uniref:hypothetical protein n=1 Tax=Arthrobacter sp. NPDC056691 TaxID=3345913 RepID=UPI00366C7973